MTLSWFLKHTALVFCLSDFVEAASFWDSQYLTGILHRVDFVPMIFEDRWEEDAAGDSRLPALKDPESLEHGVLTLSHRKSRQYQNILRERSETIGTKFYRLGLDRMTLHYRG